MIPRPVTITVGNDLFLAGLASSAAPSFDSCSMSTRAFNRIGSDGPTQLPLLASGESPSSQSAQVPSQVMIWLSPQSSARQAALSSWPLVYGKHLTHSVLSTLYISLSPTHSKSPPVPAALACWRSKKFLFTHLVLLRSGTLPSQHVWHCPSARMISSGPSQLPI